MDSNVAVDDEKALPVERDDDVEKVVATGGPVFVLVLEFHPTAVLVFEVKSEVVLELSLFNVTVTTNQSELELGEQPRHHHSLDSSVAQLVVG